MNPNDLPLGNESEPRRTGRRFDQVRFAVAPASEEAGGGFQVQVFINGHEVTEDGAGMGMDPYDVLIPDNRLIAGREPHRLPIARCSCGSYGCGMTDITISRDGPFVRWDWHRETPMDRSLTFLAADYDAEVDRLWRDRTWETPERVAGRLVLESLDAERLAESGLVIDWVSANEWDADRFCVCLRYADTHQVFLSWPWQGRTPEQLAAEVAKQLSMDPRDWNAAWHQMTPGDSPPAIAGPAWRRHSI